MNTTHTVRTYQQLPQRLSNYVFIKSLGQGATASVFLAQHVPTNKYCAIKMIDVNNANVDVTHVIREIEIMRRTDSLFIVKIYEFFIEDNFIAIVMEYCEGGSLLGLLMKHDQSREAPQPIEYQNHQNNQNENEKEKEKEHSEELPSIHEKESKNLNINKNCMKNKMVKKHHYNFNRIQPFQKTIHMQRNNIHSYSIIHKRSSPQETQAAYPNSFPALSERQISVILCEMVTALLVLHNNGIIHRDIKLENILLDKYGHIRISDFGLSRIVFDVDNNSNDFDHRKNVNYNNLTICGSPVYASPEMVKRQSYNEETDVWSLGVVLYSLVYRTFPFNSSNIQQLYHKILFDEPTFDSNVNVSHQLIDLISRMLDKNFDTRITLQEIIVHPFNDFIRKKIENTDIASTCNLDNWYFPKLIDNIAEKNSISSTNALEMIKSHAFNDVTASYRILRDNLISEKLNHQLGNLSNEFSPISMESIERLLALDDPVMEENIDSNRINDEHDANQNNIHLISTEKVKNHEIKKVVLAKNAKDSRKFYPQRASILSIRKRTKPIITV
ncbi:hypothetical protein TRFO_19212 [Tritrichomonas foetus]|uniref:Protein kinase domain-containing protein n=1 Tax=Tritrichomonas foetus TaxID=1144522 RepID=A0A1J4KK60_9EUKA|nr:hypothetical protein TRFO_19212 [Tritrichomonas foetus]|eukprot:OHT11336.1 hypothetical protein TRFO_19212 [Tritrichomonas foetus]